jgi:hypothetical protein
MAKKLKIYNGSSWEDVTFAITPPNTNVTNAFTTNQVVDTSTSVAALRITQRGAGEALRVEDETNPDSSPFVINSAGLVGIGTASPDSALHIVAAGDTTINITKTGQSIWYLQSLDSGTFRIYSGTANAERMRIGSTGNLGLGNTNPQYKLDLANSFTSATVGDTSLFIRAIASAGNQDILHMYSERTLTGGAAWSTQDWILRRHVDATTMGGFRWAAGDQNVRAIYGTPTTPSIRTSHISTSAPSGGIDGDIWLVYTA